MPRPWLLLALLAGSSARATTIVPPRDLGELLRMSDAVVYARAAESWVEPTEAIPHTVTRFEVLRVLSGVVLGSEIQVQEPGGRAGDLVTVIAGSPRYVIGSRYVLFLDRGAGLRWRSRVMSYGLLVEDAAGATLRPLPEAAGLGRVRAAPYERPSSYARDALLTHLEEVGRGAAWDSGRAAAPRSIWDELHDDPASCEWLLWTPPPPEADSLPFRYFGFDLGGVLSIRPTTPAQTGIDSITAVGAAVAAWTNDPGSVINYTALAPAVTTANCADGDASVVGEAIFNDPCSQIPNLAGCVGTLGFGGSSFSTSTITFHGHSWHPGQGAYAVINNGAECVGVAGFQEMLAHELGHSLGFGHHTDANALMDGLLHNPSTGAVLQATDRACADYAYHAGDAVRRQEFARLVLRATLGSGYTPPVCDGVTYSDVDCATTPHAAFIEDLDTRDISEGCSLDDRFCPSDAMTRKQAAMMFLKARGIGPDPCPGPNAGYDDVLCTDPFGPWIKELRDQGYTLGCNAGNTLFCPDNALTRSQIHLWFVRAGLSIPSPTP